MVKKSVIEARVEVNLTLWCRMLGILGLQVTENVKKLPHIAKISIHTCQISCLLTYLRCLADRRKENQSRVELVRFSCCREARSNLWCVAGKA